ncbi:14141_t:CDS:2, partial [Acaulospora colombiana]
SFNGNPVGSTVRKYPTYNREGGEICASADGQISRKRTRTSSRMKNEAMGNLGEPATELVQGGSVHTDFLQRLPPAGHLSFTQISRLPSFTRCQNLLIYSPSTANSPNFSLPSSPFNLSVLQRLLGSVGSFGSLQSAAICTKIIAAFEPRRNCAVWIYEMAIAPGDPTKSDCAAL